MKKSYIILLLIAFVVSVTIIKMKSNAPTTYEMVITSIAPSQKAGYKYQIMLGGNIIGNYKQVGIRTNDPYYHVGDSLFMAYDPTTKQYSVYSYADKTDDIAYNNSKRNAFLHDNPQKLDTLNPFKIK